MEAVFLSDFVASVREVEEKTPPASMPSARGACSSVSMIDSSTSKIQSHREQHGGDVLLLGNGCQLQHVHAAARVEGDRVGRRGGGRARARAEPAGWP